MKVIGVKQPGGLENLAIIEKKDPIPEAGEVVIRWHATSLNYHDYLVAIGGIPVPDGRIPMSDGAGEICLLYTSPSPRDATLSRMPSSA